ncbi:uncharacterized protein LOC111088380 [Limulus polyphemus]|uniref:Uncharacterized protein LOC111088380 n=1 Tax=Limulus polyphemus TaxID=6850 RepID=A0ABM1TDS0_LIMPO|nr:uncharacterized protein LOC111088380 [Limulus polyphemus]
MAGNSNYKNIRKDKGENEPAVASSEIKHDETIAPHEESRRTYDETFPPLLPPPPPPISAYVIAVKKDNPLSKEGSAEGKTNKIDNHPEPCYQTGALYSNTSQSAVQEKQCFPADGYSISEDSRSDRQFLNLETMERTTCRPSSEAGRSYDETTIQASVRQFKAISDLVDMSSLRVQSEVVTNTDPEKDGTEASYLTTLLHNDDVFKCDDQELGTTIPPIVLPKAQTKMNRKNVVSSIIPPAVNEQHRSYFDYRLTIPSGNQVK